VDLYDVDDVYTFIGQVYDLDLQQQNYYQQENEVYQSDTESVNSI
jgi:hypothetical protein